MMVASKRKLPLMAIAFLAALVALPVDAAESTPQSTVQAFNDAVSSENLDGMLALFAKGGVQFTNKSSHEGILPSKLTEDLGSYWSGIAPVIFTATSSYTRKVSITDARIEGDVATVWADIDTRSVRIVTGSVKEQRFKEVYLLILTPEGWRIAGILDSREASTLDKPA